MFVAAITLALATAAAAAPAPRADVERRSISKLPFHFPTSHTETVPSSGRSHLGAVSETKAVSIATDFLTGKLGLAAGEFQAESHFTDHRGIVHVYGAQFKNGVRIANHQAAAHVKNGEVVTFSSSFGATSQFTKPKVPAATAKLTGEQAAAKAAASVGIPYFKDFGTAAEYVNTGSGVVYAYKLQLRNLAKAEWVQVWADANTGEVVQAIDFTNKASYKAIPLPKINPNDGFTLISNPEDATASSAGWLDASGTSKGNNAIAAKLDANYNPVTFASATSADVFDSAFDANADPSTAANLRAATINLFYLTNMIHDISYHYGFTEAAGNFQANNFGKGGQGNDAVLLSVQDAHDTDNADFTTPGDGQTPLMRMFIFTQTNPRRDGSLEATIPLHEYTHGISNRLTGGKATAQCLQTTEAKGMGEGWSDFVALTLTAKSSDTATQARPVGDYVMGSPGGVRSAPYSTDLSVNPLTYKNLGSVTEVHSAGEIWAAMLWEVYWNLVNKKGFNANLIDSKSPAGNIVALQLVIGGLMQQPCNPTFLTARDAILAADKTYYDGANQCDIWKGFAKRGLGFSATATRANANDLPSECTAASPTPSPASPTPSPASPTPSPASPTPSPASPTPSPASPTPKSSSPVDTPSSTPVDTPSSTPVDTPTSTPVDTPTSTPVDTPTSTPVDTPTSTPVDTPTPSTTKKGYGNNKTTKGETPKPTPTETPNPTPVHSTTKRGHGYGHNTKTTKGETPKPTPTETPEPTPVTPPTTTKKHGYKHNPKPTPEVPTPNYTETPAETPEPTPVTPPTTTKKHGYKHNPKPTPEVPTPNYTETPVETPEPTPAKPEYTPAETPEPTPVKPETPHGGYDSNPTPAPVPKPVYTPVDTPAETPEPTPAKPDYNPYGGSSDATPASGYKTPDVTAGETPAPKNNGDYGYGAETPLATPTDAPILSGAVSARGASAAAAAALAVVAMLF